nr:uncharacterized protein LOC111415870 [Onthophagus taurus]
MSIVQISDHNESIYTICERIDEAPEILVEKKYKSRHTAFVRNEKKQLKTFKERATMVPAQIKRPQPQDFLKKRNGRQSVPLENLQDLKNKSRFSCSLSAKRPDVPLKDVVLCEQEEKLRHKGKNFILKNIEDVTKMKSSKPVKRIVVSVDGRRVEMGDGLLPKYIFSKKYGQVPKYVKEFHKEKDKSRQIETHFAEESVKCIDRDKVLAVSIF